MFHGLPFHISLNTTPDLATGAIEKSDFCFKPIN